MENEQQRPQEKKDEEEDPHVTLTLALFDLHWFRRLILFHLPPPPLPSRPASPPPEEAAAAAAAAAEEIEDAESRTSSPVPERLIHRRLPIHRRSLSDDLSPSPTLQIHPPKLQKILYGKEQAPGGDDYDEIPMFEFTAVEEHEQRWRKMRHRRGRRRRSENSKSLSELEFEELKGFLDLGFTFSDAEADPRLMEIVPGLQRLKAAAAGGDNDPPAAAGDDEAASSCASARDVAAPRPYLSEAWDAVEEEAEEPRLRSFMIPIAEDGVDLKNQLRFWAHAVASTVR